MAYNTIIGNAKANNTTLPIRMRLAGTTSWANGVLDSATGYYVCTLGNVPAGTYGPGTIQFQLLGSNPDVSAYNTTTVSVSNAPGGSTPTNQKPSVSFSPVTSSTPTVGVVKDYLALATDSDGSVTLAELVQVTSATDLTVRAVLASDSTSPYSLSWTPAVAGTVCLAARATDNAGEFAFSSVLTVLVQAATNAPEPLPGEGGANDDLNTTLTGAGAGTTGTAQTLTANATNPALNGSIERVDLMLMANATTLTDYQLLDTKFGGGTINFVWTPINAGPNILRARAIDDENKLDFSPPLTIDVASKHVLPYLVSPTLDISTLTRDKVADDLVVYNADQTIQNTGRALFALRGNSTATKPKKPLSDALVAADNTAARKASLFGMYTDDGYNELAEYDDQTLVKNATFLRLAKALGLIAPKFQPVERYDKSGYQGYYTLTEKVKGAILPGYTKLTKADADQVLPNLSGGYLLEIVMPAFDTDFASKNTFKTELLEDTKSGPNYYDLERYYSIELPKPADVTAAQNAYIRQYLADADASLTLPWNDPNGPQKFWDAASLVAHAIHEEFAKNCDTAALSEQWYLPRGGKLTRVIWDQDNVAPYDGVVAPTDPAGQWAALTPRLRRLYKDLAFGQAVYDAFQQKKSIIQDAIAYATDRTALYAAQGIASKQVARWGIRIPSGSQSRSRDFSLYNTNVTLFLQWMRDRLNALDNIFAGFASPVASAPAMVWCTEISTAKRLQQGSGWIAFQGQPTRYIGGEVRYTDPSAATSATSVTYFGRNVRQFGLYAACENNSAKGPVRIFIKEGQNAEYEVLPQPTQRLPAIPDGSSFRWFTSKDFGKNIDVAVRLQYSPGESAYMEDNACEWNDKPF